MARQKTAKNEIINMPHELKTIPECG